MGHHYTPEEFQYRNFLRDLRGEDQEYLLLLRLKDRRKRHWKGEENF